MKKMIRFITFCFFLVCFFNASVFADPVIKHSTSQKKSSVKKKKTIFRKGSIYVISTQKKMPVSYSRVYSKTGKTTFTTNYNIYNSENKCIANVRAIHNKKLHNVQVEIKDFQVKGNPVVNGEQVTYGTPFLGRFGSIGKVGAGGGRGKDANPGQLSVRFVSKKFDYVQVISIADAHEDSGKDLQVYILDEQSAR